MPSAIQKRSYNSVTVYSINERVVWAALETFARQLAARQEVLALVLFGSLAQGRMSVGSDVDLLVILTDSRHPFLERITHYRPDRFPVDVDVFPYTVAEIRQGQPLAREALERGRILWQRADFVPLTEEQP